MLLAVIARRSAPALAPFLAAGTALTISLLLVVAAFASEFANRIQERNTFVVAPFFLIALLVWVDRGLPRPRWVAPAVAVACALLPLAIPFERFIETAAISDTLALLPIWSAYGSLLFDSIDATVLAGGVLAAALFLFVPRRWALALPPVTLLFFVAISHNVWFGEHGFRQASVGALFQGIRVGDRDWIDRAVPKDATVAVVWKGVTDRFVGQSERVLQPQRRADLLHRRPDPGRPRGDGGDDRRGDRRDPDESWRARRPSVPAHRGRRLARRRRAGPRPRHRPDALARGEPSRRDGDADRRSVPGRHVVRQNRHLDARALSWRHAHRLALERPAAVRRRSDRDCVRRRKGRRAGAYRSRGHGARLRVRPTPERGTCRVVFRVAKTKVPGGGDDRELGAHFNTFDYRP